MAVENSPYHQQSCKLPRYGFRGPEGDFWTGMASEWCDPGTFSYVTERRTCPEPRLAVNWLQDAYSCFRVYNDYLLYSIPPRLKGLTGEHASAAFPNQAACPVLWNCPHRIHLALIFTPTAGPCRREG